MIYLALLVLGVVSLKQIPVSLMPDIDIPEITVQLSEPDMSARELENSIVKTLRQQLMQVAHLEDIKSETQDGHSNIKLTFHYGAAIDLAFIEVNEKVDRAMNYFPKSISRPKIIKASAGDIPVFYLNLTLKNSNNSEFQQSNYPLYPVSQEFVELSNFSNNVIRKRLEQLSEVGMVDCSGLVQSELLIVFDLNKLNALGLTSEELKQSINSSNIKLGNLSINDGQYRYNIRFDAEIRNKEDLENIYLKVDTRLFQLKEVAKVIEHPQKTKGLVLSRGQQAVTLAIIKQADAQMNNLKEELHRLVKQMKNDYPNIELEITRDQTRLLDYSIQNLGQTLWIGGLLAFVVMFVFLKGWKSPILIGITIPVSLIVSLLVFHLVGLSINIISLSGLILGVGMMIDNSIIVIDNINQHLQRNFRFQVKSFKSTYAAVKPELERNETEDRRQSNRRSQTLNLELITSSCASGTNEVFRPMLTSVLTTCAVFIPLIFIDGIAGSLFYDQALAITIGLLASLLVSLTLLPVYFQLMFKTQSIAKQTKKSKRLGYELFYERGFNWVMRHQLVTWGIVLVMLILSGFIYTTLPVSQLPKMEEVEKIVEIDWNQSISMDENKNRIIELVHLIEGDVESTTALIGEQQFLLDRKNSYAQTKAFLYVKAESEKTIEQSVKRIEEALNEKYNEVSFQMHSADNIFNVFFDSNKAPLEFRLRATNDFGADYLSHLNTAKSSVEKIVNAEVPSIGLNEQIILTVDPYLLLQYNVSGYQISNELKQCFSADNVFQITTNSQFLPVVIGRSFSNIDGIINETFIQNKDGIEIPIRNLIEVSKGSELKKIVAGKEGEYYPINLSDIPEDVDEVLSNIKKELKKNGRFEASALGTYFDNKLLIQQLMIILSISVVLLFFILAAQFESVFLPIIVLLEIPIDFFGVLFILKLFGAGINLMSLIGIIVMSGIIINDSILKIDTINQLRKQGVGLMKALVLSGHRRLKPIIMTSLTTVLALLPFLFMDGLGADLQRPLALAVIGGMMLGTLVSLYFIPLCYYYLVKIKLVK